jgi:hypothetical protein
MRVSGEEETRGHLFFCCEGMGLGRMCPPSSAMLKSSNTFFFYKKITRQKMERILTAQLGRGNDS